MTKEKLHKINGILLNNFYFKLFLITCCVILFPDKERS